MLLPVTNFFTFFFSGVDVIFMEKVDAVLQEGLTKAVCLCSKAGTIEKITWPRQFWFFR